jgi:NADH:ubiquinone oxidoreductase subunit F (NADH-binding)
MSSAAARERGRQVPDPRGLPRLLAGLRRHDRTGPSLDEHVSIHGGLPRELSRREAARVVELVSDSGLRGRGGAGFPTGVKLRAVAERGGRAVVVANGCEGEPASAKDRVLLRTAPHLVLDGLGLAAAAVGADDAIVAVAETAVRELEVLEQAVAERLHGRVDAVPPRVVLVPEGFVSGEETALVNFLSGGPSKPTFTPPRPFERGVAGRPTLVQNVETLAHLSLVGRYGPGWFRALGTDEEPGTALVTLDGAVRRPAVYEIPIGLPVRDLVERAGGATAPIAAFLVGGYFGTWIEAARAFSLDLSGASLRSAGASLGAGTVVALPEGGCGVTETARVLRYLAGESVGQCGPCLYGLDALASSFEGLTRGGRSTAKERTRIERRLGQIEGRGACGHPDGAVRLARSALAVFGDEIDRHARGHCTGGGSPFLRIGGRR